MVQEYGPNYKRIQRSFPLKHRKQCRARYLRLCEILKTTSLDDYHHLFLNAKRSGLRLGRLDKLAKYLEISIHVKQSGAVRHVREIDLEFLKLRRPPSEKEVESYFMTFPVRLMRSALNRLADYLLHIIDKWKEIVPEAERVESMETKPINPMAGFNRSKNIPLLLNIKLRDLMNQSIELLIN